MNRADLTYNPDIVRHLVSTVEQGKPAALDYIKKITGYTEEFCIELLAEEVRMKTDRLADILAKSIFKFKGK